MKCPVISKSQSEQGTIVESWGSLTWLAGAKLTGTSLTLGRVTIQPGEANPRHCHDNCEEVLYLLRGQLRHSLGEESFELVAGDALVAPAGVMHNAVNTGEEVADMIVAYSSGERDFRLEA